MKGRAGRPTNSNLLDNVAFYSAGQCYYTRDCVHLFPQPALAHTLTKYTYSMPMFWDDIYKCSFHCLQKVFVFPWYYYENKGIVVINITTLGTSKACTQRSPCINRQGRICINTVSWHTSLFFSRTTSLPNREFSLRIASRTAKPQLSRYLRTLALAFSRCPSPPNQGSATPCIPTVTHAC